MNYRIFLVLILLSLAGCKETYPCNSRERVSDCESYLGYGYDMEFFDEVEDTCGFYSRTSSNAIRNARVQCVAGYFPDVEFEVIQECYNGNTGIGTFLEAVACIENGGD